MFPSPTVHPLHVVCCMQANLSTFPAMLSSDYLSSHLCISSAVCVISYCSKSMNLRQHVFCQATVEETKWHGEL